MPQIRIYVPADALDECQEIRDSIEGTAACPSGGVRLFRLAASALKRHRYLASTQRERRRREGRTRLGRPRKS